jgi:hypothetical protein
MELGNRRVILGLLFPHRFPCSGRTLAPLLFFVRRALMSRRVGRGQHGHQFWIMHNKTSQVQQPTHLRGLQVQLVG